MSENHLEAETCRSSVLFVEKLHFISWEEKKVKLIKMHFA